MLKRLLFALVLLALLAFASLPAFAQTGVWTGNAPPDTASTRMVIGASSGNVAAASAVATLVAAQGRTTYLCGFSITSTGSTAAAVVNATVNGTGMGHQYVYASVAGATLANQPLVVNFAPCLPAFAVNQSINVTLPSLGAGNTNTVVNAWGYQY